jgi:glucose-6-phosphate isomerase
VHEELQAGRAGGAYAFFDLPYDTELLDTIRRVAKPLLEWCWELVILGIGGSALGTRALHQALCHPQHNMLPVGRRKHHPGSMDPGQHRPGLSFTGCWTLST